MSLLEFAEFVANHKSANLHGFHEEVVTAARKAVKAKGGRLDAIGRYPEGGTVPKPYGWGKSYKYDRERDAWIEKEKR